MTKQADFKRRVRARMDKTGESYTAARARLLAGARRAARHQRRLDRADAAPDGAGRAARRLARRAARGPGARRRRRAAARAARRVPGPRWASRRWCCARSRSATARSRRGRGGEYVLWFEADLYDQLQLAQIVARLAALGVAPERVTLICIGEHRGIAHFGGLGELEAEQLERLPRKRRGDADRRHVRSGDAGVGRAARARSARARGDRRGPLAGASLPPRGLRPPGPRVPVDARRAVAHRAPPAGRGGRRRGHPGRGVPARERARGAALPRRHVGLRGARPPGGGRRPAARRPAPSHRRRWALLLRGSRPITSL